MPVDFGFEEEESVVSGDFDLELFLRNTKQHWSNEAKFRSWVRSGLRQAFWNEHPVKMEFLELHKMKIKNPDPNPRKGAELIWGYECNICGCQMRRTPRKGEKKQFEVDHKTGENSFKGLEDLVQYFKKMVFVTSADLQILCKRCHGIKTYTERYGVSWNRAKAIKKAKDMMLCGDYVSELNKFGYTGKFTKVKSEEILVEVYEKQLNGGDSG